MQTNFSSAWAFFCSLGIEGAGLEAVMMFHPEDSKRRAKK